MILAGLLEKRGEESETGVGEGWVEEGGGV